MNPGSGIFSEKIILCHMIAGENSKLGTYLDQNPTEGGTKAS